MRLRWCLTAFVLLLNVPGNALARSHFRTEVDRYCMLVRSQLSASNPLIFSGPDPWAELDEAPIEMPDQALAYVYTAGPSVRWVFLRIEDQEGGWAEDVEYYFREDGSIAKRLRKLDSVEANMVLEVTTYYDHEQIAKEVTHHHALGRGRQNSSDLADPDAPVYLSVDDLPFSDILDLWRRLS